MFPVSLSRKSQLHDVKASSSNALMSRMHFTIDSRIHKRTHFCSKTEQKISCFLCVPPSRKSYAKASLSNGRISRFATKRIHKWNSLPPIDLDLCFHPTKSNKRLIVDWISAVSSQKKLSQGCRNVKQNFHFRVNSQGNSANQFAWQLAGKLVLRLG